MIRTTPELWLQIKTDYQLGKGIRELEREYKIPSSTIATRKTKEGWTQEASKKIQAIQDDIKMLEQNFDSAQLPLVYDKLDEVIQLQKSVNNFVKGAISLNIKNLQAALAEPDPDKRISMTARMKATMADIAGIGNIKPLQEIPEKNEDNEDSNGIVQFYLPHKNKE